GLIGHLMRARAEGRHSMGPGKFIAGIVICGMLVALPSFINAGGTQMGFRADSFGPIAYVQPTTFGAAAGAANAMLSLVKLAGVGFAM
ncbi:conjugal transfer protein TraQ, partial [Escherichia coli]|nr:conjugal transfer protein TraQ [Escherichia coli]